MAQSNQYMDNNELIIGDGDAKNESASFFKRVGGKTTSYFYSLKNRLRLAILGTAVLLSLLLLIISFFILAAYQKKETYENLKVISQFKRDQIEQYYRQIESQIVLATRDERLTEAFGELADGFASIESDSYELPDYKELSSMSDALENYYKSEVLPALLSKSDRNNTPVGLFPEGDKTRILQFLYIANNSLPQGFKYKMLKAGDASAYSNAHQRYQNYFRELLSQVNISDILLVNGSNGDIVYSFQKNIDFATNIFDGRFKNTNLALACQKALASSNSDNPAFSDFELYLPEMYRPVSFIAKTIAGNSGDKGLLVFQLSANAIDNILSGTTTEKVDHFIKAGGDLYLVGEDFEYRSDDLRLNTLNGKFIKKLEDAGIRKNIVSRIDSLGTTIKLLALKHGIFEKALLGYDGVIKFRDVSNTRVYADIAPVNTKAGNWFLVVQKDRKSVYNTVNKLMLWGLLVLFILTLMILFLASRFSNVISSRLKKIKFNLHETMLGHRMDATNVKSADELGETAQLVDDLSSRISNASDFALELSAGNMEADFQSVGENDMFASALIKLKESLVHARNEEEKRKVEDEMRNWTTQGIAKFNDLLRHENDNIERFAYLIIKSLVEYLHANQGSIFLMEGEEGEEKLLNLVASVAWDKQKFTKKQISIGEGLVGQVVLEKQTIFLKDIPEDYFTITSGLGDANPRSLIIVPMLYNDVVTGVIEIASFNEFKSFEIEFVEKIAESTSITLNSVRLNVRTKLLLEESNERAEELAAQEEEMRQNLEELKATQEEMTRVKEESARKDAQRMEQQKLLLDQMKINNEELQEKATLLEWEKLMFTKLMDNIPARVTFKDTESRYIRINRAKVKALGINDQEEVMGKTDLDIFGGAHGQKALNEEKQMIRSGVSMENKEELIKFKDGRVTWGSTSRIPLRDEDDVIKGALVITWDITEMKNAQFRLEINNKIVHNLASNMPVLHYSIDQKGNIIFFKGKALNFLKMKEEEMNGKDFYSMYPELKPILEFELGDDGYTFVQHVGNHEFRHIIYANKTTNGGFSGVAFDVNVSDI